MYCRFCATSPLSCIGHVGETRSLCTRGAHWRTIRAHVVLQSLPCLALCTFFTLLSVGTSSLLSSIKRSLLEVIQPVQGFPPLAPPLASGIVIINQSQLTFLSRKWQVCVCVCIACVHGQQGAMDTTQRGAFGQLSAMEAWSKTAPAGCR